MEGSFYIVIVGLVAAWLARTLAPGAPSDGVLADLLVAAIGAITGGALFNVLLGQFYGGLAGGIGFASVGAILLLFGLGAIRGSVISSSH